MSRTTHEQSTTASDAGADSTGQHAVRSQTWRWLETPWDLGLAAWDGWATYLAQALSPGGEGLDPLRVAEDAAEWLRVVSTRAQPEWVHDHRVAREWPEARLLDFSSEGDVALVPTLVLPPQAGHASTIVDYSREQSQLMTARQAGLDRLYAMDWKPATPETSSASIDDYIGILDDAVEELGGRVNLVGDCQGGWLATIYAAVHPAKVHSLALGGAPIDFHAGRSAIQEWVDRLRGSDDTAFYRLLVAMGGGNHLGASQILGFKMLEPAQEFERLMQLWGNIRDERYVARHIEFTNWFEWAQDVPGTFYLWIVEHLFVRNELVQGTLRVVGNEVDLGAISCPLFLLAGSTDHITPAEQAFALAEHTSTPADQVHREVVDAGHLGLFMGRRALAEHWAPIFGRVAELSRA